MKDWMNTYPKAPWHQVTTLNIGYIALPPIYRTSNYTHRLSKLQSKPGNYYISLNGLNSPPKSSKYLSTLCHLVSPDSIIPAWISEQVTHTSEVWAMILHKSFAQIQATFNAPNKDYFNNYRIQQCLLAHPHLEGTIPTRVWNYFSNSTDSKGISLIYSTLQKRRCFENLNPF